MCVCTMFSDIIKQFISLPKIRDMWKQDIIFIMMEEFQDIKKNIASSDVSLCESDIYIPNMTNIVRI